MNKTVVICLNPFVSHFIPTIALANRIRSLGNQVIYLGFADMESSVQMRGFGYLAIKSVKNQELVRLRKEKAYKKLAQEYRKLHDEIQALLEECKADLVLIGLSRFLIYLPPSFSANIDVLFYSLCAGMPVFNLRYPPATSDSLPASKVICFLRWFERFLRKGLAPNLLFEKRFYPWPELFRLCKERKIHWKFGIDGFLPAFPVIVLGTKHLEFGPCDEGLKFAGLCVDKKETFPWDDRYLSFANDVNPLIYCCLGTMSDRYPNGKGFLLAVIELMKQNPQWNLILSLGKREGPQRMEIPADNIHIVNFVPQLDVLRHVDIALIHGGYATVKECIDSGVPMLVFSCSYDQHGNAARVQYHQIGVKSPLLKRTLFQRLFGVGKRRIMVNEIKLLIESVLGQEKYHNNICKLREKIGQDSELDDTVRFILGQCSRSPAKSVDQ